MNLLQTYMQNWILAMVMLIPYFCLGQYHVKPFDISKKITSLQNTEEGYLFYGTESGEFGRYDGLQFIRIANLNANIHSIEIHDEHLYILTDKGFYEIKDGQSIQMCSNKLDVLAKSKDNTFLVTTNGVYNAIKTDYLPNKEAFYDINEISYASYFNIDGLECFRADNKIYIKKKKWREAVGYDESDFGVLPWTSRQMLICDRKALFSIDKEGFVDTLLDLHTANRNKIFKLTGTKILLCSNDSIGVFDVRKKTLNNFYSINTSLISDVSVDEWGNIWISAGSYLYEVIDQSNEDRNDPPKITIESIQINGIDQEIKSTYRLDEDDNEIEIDYSGIHMTFPQNLEYQSKFSVKYHSIGQNISDKGEWSEATKKRKIEYQNLKAGKYTFQLRATVDGEYFMYSKPIVFSIESKLFQSIWLIVIFGAIGVLLLAIFFNSRYNTLKEKSKKDRDKLIQENQMLTLQQKALQLQMNPHFVFNALNSIQGLIATNDNQKARRYLQEFSTMMRSVLNQSRKETILLSEEIKYLKSYLKLEQMANNERFDWDIKLNADVEDDIRIPTMIIQPFVENAILHGVKPLKDRRGKIILSFERVGGNLLCKIVDNGIGRKTTELKKKKSHQSVALKVVRERLSTKRSSTRDQPFHYIDLVGEENQPLGTEVLVNIPIMN